MSFRHKLTFDALNFMNLSTCFAIGYRLLAIVGECAPT
jgi:hypothetical protein